MKTITVKVIPKASKSEVIGWENDLLKIRLKAVPEKGEANEELVRVLADYFDIPKSQITIIRGHKSRTKTVQIE
jgi:uncharacterized protein (TIGR00251 family)